MTQDHLLHCATAMGLNPPKHGGCCCCCWLLLLLLLLLPGHQPPPREPPRPGGWCMVTAAPAPAARRLGRVSPRGPARVQWLPGVVFTGFHWPFTGHSLTFRLPAAAAFPARRRQRARRRPAGQLLPGPRGHARAHAPHRPAPLRAQEEEDSRPLRRRPLRRRRPVARQALPGLCRVICRAGLVKNPARRLIDSCLPQYPSRCHRVVAPHPPHHR